MVEYGEKTVSIYTHYLVPGFQARLLRRGVLIDSGVVGVTSELTHSLVLVVLLGDEYPKREFFASSKTEPKFLLSLHT